MKDSDPQDSNRKWRRAWRFLHSPLILLPAVATCTAAAAADVAEAIPRFGWVAGALLVQLLIAGMLISLIDLVPHFVGWLCAGQTRASAALTRAGQAFRALSVRIATITSDR